MKIIQVCPKFYPSIGGIETQVFELAKRLSKKHEVRIYTTDPSGKLPKEETIQKIKIKRFKSIAPNDAYFFSPQLYFALKKETCDILHIHSFQALTSFLAYLAIKKPKFKRLVFTPHYHPIGGTKFRSFVRKFYDNIQKKILIDADKIICVSNYEKNLITKKFKINSEKLIIIPNGINIDIFKKMPKIRKEKNFQILYVGRIERYKRIYWILFAFKRLIEKLPNKNLRLVIIGSGPFKNKLIGFCKKLNITNYVILKENLSNSDLLEEYYKSNVLVQPSEFEIFGIVILEALACNKPVIVSNSGALPEIVGGNGFLINNVDELEKSLLLVLKNKNKLKIDFDIKQFSWERIASNLLKVYHGE